MGEVAGHLHHYTRVNPNRNLVALNGNDNFQDINAFNEGIAWGHLRDVYGEALQRADTVYQQARRNGLPRGQFNLDPNAFIQSSDKMRRLLWRVVE